MELKTKIKFVSVRFAVSVFVGLAFMLLMSIISIYVGIAAGLTIGCVCYYTTPADAGLPHSYDDLDALIDRDIPAAHYEPAPPTVGMGRITRPAKPLTDEQVKWCCAKYPAFGAMNMARLANERDYKCSRRATGANKAHLSAVFATTTKR